MMAGSSAATISGEKLPVPLAITCCQSSQPGAPPMAMRMGT